MRPVVLLGAIAALGLWAMGAHHASGATPACKAASVSKETASFTSGGMQIQTDVFRATGDGPVLLLVHGADGLRFERWVRVYEASARTLACAGYTVYFPHYMERTHTTDANGRTIIKNFTAWEATLEDAATFALAHTPGAPSHYAIDGLSLGAALALVAASRDERVAAVTEYFGTLPSWAAAQAKHVPPTLILHGDRDPIVPVRLAYDLQHYLESRHAHYEMKIYPNAGHGFIGPDAADALQRSITFFSAYLPPQATTTAR